MSKILAFINAHKTKIVGGLIVAIGALQTNQATVQAMMSPKHFAWFTVVAGVVVAVLGFINSSQSAQS